MVIVTFYHRQYGLYDGFAWRCAMENIHQAAFGAGCVLAACRAAHCDRCDENVGQFTVSAFFFKIYLTELAERLYGSRSCCEGDGLRFMSLFSFTVHTCF